MLVREVMSRAEPVLDEGMTVREAAAALLENGAQTAPVADAEGALVGIVSEVDLLHDRFVPDPRASALPRPGASGPAPATVGQVMTRTVVTTTEYGDAAELAERMFHTRLRCVPVLREGRVVGLVTRTDLLRMHTRTDEEVRRDVRAALAEGAPYAGDWSVDVFEGAVRLARPGADARERRLALTVAGTVPGVTRVAVDGGGGDDTPLTGSAPSDGAR